MSRSLELLDDIITDVNTWTNPKQTEQPQHFRSLTLDLKDVPENEWEVNIQTFHEEKTSSDNKTPSNEEKKKTFNILCFGDSLTGKTIPFSPFSRSWTRDNERKKQRVTQ